MLAAYTQVPELAMEQKEAEEIAKAAGDVMRHYPVDIAPKAVDWAAFMICVGTAYGSRFAAYRLRMRAEASATVHNLQVVS